MSAQEAGISPAWAKSNRTAHLGDELNLVKGDQLVDAQAGAGGHGAEQVVAGVIVVVGDAEDGIEVGAVGDAGMGAEEAGHPGGTGRIVRFESRQFE
jgi:hypothetical protein